MGEWGEGAYFVDRIAVGENDETAFVEPSFFMGMVVTGEAEIITAAEIAAEKTAACDPGDEK